MIRYLLKLSRPRFWLYLAGPVLVGVTYGATTIDGLFSIPALALFAYFLIPANVFLYGINDIFDADVDEANPKKDEREVRYRGSKVVPIAVAISVLLGLGLLLITPKVAWPWFLGFLLLGAEYSAPPLRFKTTPLLDSLSNGLYILPGAMAYAALSGTNPPLLAIVGGWLWAMAMHTFSAIPDIEPDERAGIRTTATMLGKRRTLAYCAVCWLLSAALFGLLDPRAGLLLLCYPALVVTWVVRDVAIDRAYWWYPAINTVVGMVLTVGGLWRVVRG
ncbi:prenyltransferase [Haladaptatus pallidirubidus]|uniref:Prenyltransferase n=1 Tax=Haladaptatus pallidirubidus TaxID=1008152 RepID=A0AAV3UAT5_9EURY|nr:prenyltransferase [Haladaptatus pallidirubidus]